MIIERPAGTVSAASDGFRPKSVRTLLVDEHALFRWGLRDLLERHGILVVGEASSAAEAIAEVAAKRPEVVLMDLRLPGRLGMEAIRETLVLDPCARVVVLSDSADEQDVLDALMAGACGYLLKGAPADQLVAAVRAAARGEDPIAPTVTHVLLRRLRARPPDAEAAERIGTRLTGRERQVLRLVGRGQGIREIARDLAISPKTARNHLSNLLGKLGLDNRVQASLYAARAGLLDDAPSRAGAGPRPVVRGEEEAPGEEPVGLNGRTFLRGPASVGMGARLASRLTA